MGKINKKHLAICIVVFELISMLIGYFIKEDVSGWYKTLAAPEHVPENYVFPLAWTILYALLATCAYLLWHLRHRREGYGLFSIFTIYMVLNWTWSFVFFKLHLLFPALLFIGAMNIILGLMVVFAYRVKPVITYLLLPVFLWSSYAMYLAAGYFILN